MSELSLAVKKAYDEAKGDVFQAADLLLSAIMKSEKLKEEAIRYVCPDLIRQHRGDNRRKAWQQATTKGLPAVRIDQDYKKLLDQRIEQKYRRFMLSDFTLPSGLMLGLADRSSMLCAVEVWRKNKEGNAKREKFGNLILNKEDKGKKVLVDGKKVGDCFTESQLIMLCREADFDPFGEIEEKKETATEAAPSTKTRRRKQG